MERKYTKLEKILLLIIFISLIYSILAVSYYKILINLINYIIFNPFSILSITFILTFSYQLLVQIVKTEDNRFYAFLYILLATATGLPLFMALRAEDSMLSLENVSYIILTATVSPPLVILISFFTKEKDQRNPLRPALLFMIFYIDIVLLEMATVLQRNTISYFEVKTLGIYILSIIVNFSQIIANILVPTNINIDNLRIIANISLVQLNYVIPLVFISSFIYSLITIKNNWENYQETIILYRKNIEENITIKNLAKVSLFASSLILLIFMTALQFNDHQLSLTLLSLPPMLLLIALLLATK